MSVQQTIEQSLASKPVFRYTFGFHYTQDGPLIQWAKEHWDLYYIMSYEVSGTGLPHIQGYGERSRETTKGERQVFQGKGRLSKYLNPNVTKKWWISSARKERHRNCMYVLKDVKKSGLVDKTLDLNDHLDRDELMALIDEADRLQEEISRTSEESPRNFQEKLVDWYTSKPLGLRPTKLKEIIRELLVSDLIPWSNMPNSRLVSAAEWLYVSRYNPERINALTAKMYSIEQYLDKNNMSHM